MPDPLTYEEFTKILLTPPPAGVSGGVGALSPSGQAWSTTDLRAGTYVVICFVPDAKGVPHAALGIVSKLTVK